MKFRRTNDLIVFAEWTFVLSIILSGGTMYGVMRPLFERGLNDFFLRLVCLAVSCFLIVLYFAKYRGHLRKRQTIIIVLSIAFLAIYLVASRYDVKSCLESLCVPFVLFLVISSFKGAKNLFFEFFNIYSNIIVVVAAVSLVFYFLGPVLNILSGNSLEYYNNGSWNLGINYYNLYFVNNWQTQTFSGYTFIRNIGIFMEAPGFAYPLVMTLWWELFSKTSIHKSRVVILIISIITTFSAKAFILGAMTISIFLYSHASDCLRVWRRIKWSIFPLICIVGVVLFLYILQQKIISSNGVGSWDIRMNDIVAAMRTWLKFPFFGSGFYNLKEIYSNYSVIRNTGTPTMGFLNILAFGGIYMFLGYLGGLVRYLLLIKHLKSKVMFYTFLLLTVAFMCTSGNQYSYTILLIIAIGWSISASDFKMCN